MRIAAVDDNLDELKLIKESMALIHHECHIFDNPKKLLSEFERESFDLLILDWELPHMSGPEVLTCVRSMMQERIPVLMLTNRNEEVDIVQALSLGADDFMSKPIRVNELMARVNALLRRTYQTQDKPELVFGKYRFIPLTQKIEFDNQSIVIKTKEFELAILLFRNVGRLLSRQYLKEQVWGIKSTELNSRSLDTHISSIRNKLSLSASNGYRLISVYGFGYRLEAV